jgi:hypothetical protein
MSDYTPITSEVRALYIAGTPTHIGLTRPGEEFDRWLADRDKEVAAQAIEGYRDFLERATKTHAYAMDDDDWDEHKRLTAALTAYAAHLRVAADQNGDE